MARARLPTGLYEFFQTIIAKDECWTSNILSDTYHLIISDPIPDPFSEVEEAKNLCIGPLTTARIKYTTFTIFKTYQSTLSNLIIIWHAILGVQYILVVLP